MSLPSALADPFRAWLTGRGWRLAPQPDPVDVLALNGEGSEVLVCQVKAPAAEIGSSVETAWGRLLQRMNPDLDWAQRAGADPQAPVTFGLVVVTTETPAALRVPVAVRAALRVSVFEVAAGAVVEHPPTAAD